MKPISLLLPSAACMLLCSCVTITNYGNPGPQGVLSQTVGYSISANGGKLITSQFEPSCDGTVLSNPLVTDSSAYSLSGNTLILTDTPDTLGDGGIVEENIVLAREGNGSGLQGGVWEEQSTKYPVISSGSLDSSDKAEAAQDSQFNAYEVFNFVSSTDSIFIYANAQPAKAFLADWNDAGAAFFDSVAASYVSQYVVQLRGLVTGEVVTLTFSADGQEVTYSSNLAVDSTFHYYEVPQSCPDPGGPGWYNVFLENNQTQLGLQSAGLEKVAVPNRHKVRKQGLLGVLNSLQAGLNGI